MKTILFALVAVLQSGEGDPWACLERGEEARGLALLAAGADAGLAALARRDLDGSSPPERLADEWWAAADARPDRKAPLRRRAAHMYAKAWPALEGEARRIARERLRAVLVPAQGGPEAPGMPARWNAGGAVPDPRAAHTGRCSLLLTPAEGGGGFSWAASPGLTLPASRRLLVSAWVLTEGNAADSDFLALRWYRNGEYVDQFGPPAPADQPFWTRIEAEVEVPADATGIDVAFFFRSKAGRIWIDDVSLREVRDGAGELVPNPSFEERRD